MSPDIAHVKRCMDFYRRSGLRPLPSRGDAKRPDLREFAYAWSQPPVDEVYLNWKSPNIQLVCGATDTPWSLVVVDCDGSLAREVWKEMCLEQGFSQKTWTVETGGGGIHYYFRSSPLTQAGISRKVWGLWHPYVHARSNAKTHGTWVTHEEIRVLSSGSLAIAPPSRHVTTGKEYRFADGLGPRDVAIADCPDWLNSLPSVEDALRPKPEVQIRYVHRDAGHHSSGWPDRHTVLSSLPDKASIARSWGLRICGSRPTAGGWLTCHAYDREDRNPSCGFHATNGVYKDMSTGNSLSFLDLGVALGAYPDWQSCLNHLGA